MPKILTLKNVWTDECDSEDDGVCEPVRIWFDLFKSADDQQWRRASDRLNAIVSAQRRICKRKMDFHGTYSEIKAVSDLFYWASFRQ